MVLAIPVFGAIQRRRAAMGFFQHDGGQLLFPRRGDRTWRGETRGRPDRWTYDLATLYGLQLTEGRRRRSCSSRLALACAVEESRVPVPRVLLLAHQ